MNGAEENVPEPARRRPSTLVERVADHPSFAQASEQIAVADRARHSDAAPKDAGPATRENGSRKDLGARINAEIDLRRLEAAGFLVPGGGRNRMREEFRIVKHAVLGTVFSLRKAGAWNANMVLVSSAQPREGKTFTAINLAMSIAAEPDQSVLLMDVDLTRQGIPKTLGIPADKGLVDVLQDPRLSLSDVMIRTNVDGLTVVPAGQCSAQNDEMLASERMGHLMRQFSERYPEHIVLFDSPPVLSTSQAAVLTQFMGQVVFVIEAWRTSQQVIKQALGLMDDGARIGLLLNRSDPKFGDAHFGAHYRSYAESS